MVFAQLSAGAERREEVEYSLLMQLAATVAILKAARQMGLVDDLGCVSTLGEEPVEMPEQMYQRAICHASEELQTDMMQLLCTYPKVTFMPSKSLLSIVMLVRIM